MKRMLYGVSSLMVILFASAVVSAGDNLLTDGGFETGSAVLSSWLLNVSGDAAKATRMIDSTSGTAHGGKAWDHSAMVRALEKLANFEIGQKAG